MWSTKMPKYAKLHRTKGHDNNKLRMNKSLEILFKQYWKWLFIGRKIQITIKITRYYVFIEYMSIYT